MEEEKHVKQKTENVARLQNADTYIFVYNFNEVLAISPKWVDSNIPIAIVTPLSRIIYGPTTREIKEATTKKHPMSKNNV